MCFVIMFRDGANAGWQKVYFNKTNVVMTTYLIAFAIAEYEFVENETSNDFGGETPVSEDGRTEKMLCDYLFCCQSIDQSIICVGEDLC
jgi:hypothetical protein